MQILNEIISNTLKEAIIPPRSIDIIIPVPLHEEKLKKRGFNQSLLIADSISKLTSIPISKNNLVKNKKTPPQIGLSKHQRIKNLKGSFAVTSLPEICEKSILLVDDIMTTGATLDTCASELKKVGVKEVYGLTLARTMLK